MRILVTGGSGFIGSAVCRHLVGLRGVEVMNLDALTYAATPGALKEAAAAPNYRFVHGDINDRPLLAGIFASFAPDAVMHLAAESHVDRSIASADAFITTNIVGTSRLLEAACAHWEGLDEAAATRFRFLHVSTDEVYGSLGPSGLFRETSPYDPSSPYAASKAASDHLVTAWHRTYGLPVLITNCSNNFGPYQFPEKLIPLMIINGIEGRDLPVYGDGQNVRDWLHVEDHVRALCRVLETGRIGETYNIGARNERRNLDLVHAICRLLDQRLPDQAPHDRLIRFVTDRPGHDRRYAIDPTRIETELGWRPEAPFDQAIAATVDWYLANQDWWRALRQRALGP
jgi:dTDP-glucose 4,6-dehydratase